ncbi:hypothetical protein D3C71_1366320 [compost metagenome]
MIACGVSVRAVSVLVAVLARSATTVTLSRVRAAVPSWAWAMADASRVGRNSVYSSGRRDGRAGIVGNPARAVTADYPDACAQIQMIPKCDCG